LRGPARDCAGRYLGWSIPGVGLLSIRRPIGRSIGGPGTTSLIDRVDRSIDRSLDRYRLGNTRSTRVVASLVDRSIDRLIAQLGRKSTFGSILFGVDAHTPPLRVFFFSPVDRPISARQTVRPSHCRPSRGDVRVPLRSDGHQKGGNARADGQDGGIPVDRPPPQPPAVAKGAECLCRTEAGSMPDDGLQVAGWVGCHPLMWTEEKAGGGAATGPTANGSNCGRNV
jgi:hypothetical protein